MIVDLCGIDGGDGTIRKEKAQEIGTGLGQLVQRKTAAEISARIARSPVPAEGSRTTSRGVICAAARAASPMGSGVENCW